MIENKYIGLITAVFLFISLITCGFIVYAANNWDTISIPEYQNKIFGDDIITIDIKVNEDDWQSLIDNAQAKEWISADLVINGEQISTVGIRTKGNSSLMQTKNNKYSLQFEFNKYVKGQSFYGLDSLCINNMLADSTYMKDYISYDIMKYIGVDTPLVNYAKVTVNGEDYGFCIALERYDESFLDRVYNSTEGELYNVKGTMGNKNDNDKEKQNIDKDSLEKEITNFKKGAGKMGFGGANSSGGGSLIYTDDEYESYSSIFDNAVSKVSDSDKNSVITALKNLNAGTNLETYFDVDEILRYFAAHTVLVNLDSYSSNMQQNYYIYEKDGKISILPWDYGLAFGGFQSGDASSVVNFPIDTPVSEVSMEDRPLLNKLLEVEEYKEKYHSYLKEIVEGYFESGLFESTVNKLDDKINEYVKNNDSPYTTYEKYQAAIPELIKIVNLRAESINGQLEGTIPSTTEGQNNNKEALIDCSDVNLSALGTMGGGGMGKGEFNLPNGNAGQSGMTPPTGNTGQGGMTPPTGNKERPSFPSNGNGNMPQGMNPNMNGTNGMSGMQATVNPVNIVIIIVSVILLVVAIIFVAKPKKDVI